MQDAGWFAGLPAPLPVCSLHCEVSRCVLERQASESLLNPHERKGQREGRGAAWFRSTAVCSRGQEEIENCCSTSNECGN
jgi:hypothetical protein